MPTSVQIDNIKPAPLAAPSEVGAGANRDWITATIRSKVPTYTPFGVGRCDGDDKADVIARQESSGNLVFFKGGGNTGFYKLGTVF